MALDPTRIALGAWGGGRFMAYGEPLSDERLVALLRPGDGVDTVITADVYGAGDADRLVGRSLAGLERDSYCLVGAVGHDLAAERQGAKGYPRFTRTRARDAWGSYLREAAESSLRRLGVDAFDLLLLHNPDRAGYSDPAVWEGMEALRGAGLTRLLGVAPGPANGFTLDLLGCFERFGTSIDWAMVILNPLEPWPGGLVLEAAAAHDVKTITRVVDYGGLFWDDVRSGHAFAPRDHRLHRPAGWIERGLERLDALRPIAGRHGLTPMQLACAWNFAQPSVACVAPTLIQEPGGRPVESKRAELAALGEVALGEGDVAEIRTIGDNSGSMRLKGAAPDHEGAEQPDRWALSDELVAAGRRWGVEPARDLVQSG